MTLGRPKLPQQSSVTTALLADALKLSARRGHWQHFMLLWSSKAAAAFVPEDRFSPSVVLEDLCKQKARCAQIARRLVGLGCYRSGSGAERHTRLAQACVVAGNQAFLDFLSLNPGFAKEYKSARH